MVAERCYELVLRLYDDKEQWYYGEGAIVIGNPEMEGYICNDYLLITPISDSVVSVTFFNLEDKMKYMFPVYGKSAFPGKFRLKMEKPNSKGTRQIRIMCIDAVKSIVSGEKCEEAIQRIERLRVMYRQK